MFLRIKDVFEKAKFVIGLDNYGAAEAYLNDFGLQALRKLPYKFAFPKKQLKLTLEKITSGPNKGGYMGKLPEDFNSLYSAGFETTLKQGFDKTSDFSINGCHIYANSETIELFYFSIPIDEDGDLLIEENLEDAVVCYLVAKVAESKAYAPTTAPMFRAMQNDQLAKFALLSHHLFGVANSPNQSELVAIAEANRTLNVTTYGTASLAENSWVRSRSWGNWG